MRFERRRIYQRKKDQAQFREIPSRYKAKLDELRGATSRQKKGKIIVIGAGMAGLAIAFELEKHGFEVVVLEAQTNHVGGRVRTYRKNGLIAELGAMRVPKIHFLTNHYIEEFALETRTFVQENPDTYAYFRGQRRNRSEKGIEELKGFYNLLPKEKELTADQIWEKSIVNLLDGLSSKAKQELYEPIITENQLLEIDQKSLYNQLKVDGWSTEAIEFVASSYGVPTYLPTALTEHLREESDQVWLGEFLELTEGMDALASAFEKRLSRPIRKGAKVFKIASELDGAAAYYQDQSRKIIKVTGDWLVCTLPLGVLSKLDIEEAFSPQKINAIRSVNYDSSSKVITHTRNRFWELKDGIYGGGSIWDGGLGHTWYPSDNSYEKTEDVSRRESFLLASYTWGQSARRIDSISKSQLNQYIYWELKKIHPYIKEDDLLGSIRWSWENFEYSAGAFAFFEPGNHTDLMNHLMRHEQSILLAGEHCSFTHSWIQGAFESAIDACLYIKNKYV